MPIAIRTSDLETGNPTVHSQHKRLFQVVNEPHSGLVLGKAQEDMELIRWVKELAQKS